MSAFFSAFFFNFSLLFDIIFDLCFFILKSKFPLQSNVCLHNIYILISVNFLIKQIWHSSIVAILISYCECFAAGVFCAEPCSCQSCFNKPIHQETVLNTRKQIESRNPLAFAPKVIRPSDPDQEIGVSKNSRWILSWLMQCNFGIILLFLFICRRNWTRLQPLHAIKEVAIVRSQAA